MPPPTATASARAFDLLVVQLRAERSNRWAMWTTQSWMVIGWWFQPFWEINRNKPSIVILGLVYWAGLGGYRRFTTWRYAPKGNPSCQRYVAVGYWLLMLKSRSTFTQKWLDTSGWLFNTQCVTNDTRPSRSANSNFGSISSHIRYQIQKLEANMSLLCYRGPSKQMPDLIRWAAEHTFFNLNNIKQQ